MLPIAFHISIPACFSTLPPSTSAHRYPFLVFTHVSFQFALFAMKRLTSFIPLPLVVLLLLC